MKLQRVYQFLVVLLLILPARIFSQQQMPRIGQNSPHLLNLSENFQGKLRSNNQFPHANLQYFIFADKIPYQLTPPNRTVINLNFPDIIRQEFYTSLIPFFCKKEFQFEQNTSIPLRVRLGSLDYVNRLEGKN